MFSAGELSALRTMSQTAMPDQATIVRPAAGGSLNPANGIYVPNAPTPIYSGRMRVKSAGTDDFVALFGDTQVTSERHVGVLPFDAPEVIVDDIVTVTVSSDPRIAGCTFRVRAIPHGSYLVDRRLGLEIVL